MANIVPSTSAPSEKLHISLSSVEFDLEPGGSFSTEDAVVVADAKQHPWLEVKADVVASEPEPAPVEPPVVQPEPVPNNSRKSGKE